MARNMYGATSADFTLTSGGRVVPGATLTIWSARTGGTQITDLLDVDSVATTTVTSDADGSIVYYGPNNDKTVHWADSGVGNRIAVRPTDITGETGPQGAKGDKGDTGAKGDKGDTGDLANLDIGTVTTGSPAAAHIEGNFEDGYELDLTLPSVGAGSIHNADVNAAADIDRSKIAGTALTSESMGVHSVLDYGATGDGETDDTTAIQAAAIAAAGATLLFPAGMTFAVSDTITLSSGTTVLGDGATLEKTAKASTGLTHGPCLDIIQCDDVTIRGLTVTTNVARTYTGGASERGGDCFNNWAGIYLSGNRITVDGCGISGFTTGVRVCKWDGTGMTGDCADITIRDIRVDDVDFGVLLRASERVQVDGLSGTWSLSATSPNPPHLFYCAETVEGALISQLTISGVRGYDSTGGHCVQIKTATDVTVTDVATFGCGGLLSTTGVSRMHVDGMIATDDTPPDNGSIYMFTGAGATPISDVTLTNIVVDMPTATTTARAGRLAGDRVVASGLRSMFNWSAVSENSEWYIADCSDVTVTDVVSVNRSAYGATVVAVATNAVDARISDVRAVNCATGCVYDGAATGRLDIDSTAIKFGTGSAASARAVYRTGTGAVTVVDRAPAIVNMLSANQASGTDALGDTTGFGIAGTHAVTSSDVAPIQGTNSLRTTFGSTGAGGAILCGGPAAIVPATLVVVPATDYTFQVELKADEAATFNLRFNWYQADGTTAVGVSDSRTFMSSATATRFAVTATAPALAERVSVYVRRTGGGNGAVWTQDKFAVSLGNGGPWAMPVPAVAGARDEPEGALASLITQLVALGLVTDSTTAS